MTFFILVLQNSNTGWQRLVLLLVQDGDGARGPGYHRWGQRAGGEELDEMKMVTLKIVTLKMIILKVTLKMETFWKHLFMLMVPCYHAKANEQAVGTMKDENE